MKNLGVFGVLLGSDKIEFLFLYSDRAKNNVITPKFSTHCNHVFQYKM